MDTRGRGDYELLGNGCDIVTKILRCEKRNKNIKILHSAELWTWKEVSTQLISLIPHTPTSPIINILN